MDKKLKDFVPDENGSSEYAMNDDFVLTSMLYWYPITRDLDIKQPRTNIIELDKKGFSYLGVLDGDFTVIWPQLEDFKEAARDIGYPLFMRTDLTSIKHSWKETCYVEKEDDLERHILRFIDGSGCEDRPINAFVFREYIPMNTMFTEFFGETPINPEVRFFIWDGKITCWHWYWIEEVIANFRNNFRKYSKSPSNWKEIMHEEMYKLTSTMTSEGVSPLVELTRETMKVAKAFKEGYWSVDFSQAADGTWYMIDMATGGSSWHPESCSVHKRYLKMIREMSE